MKVDMKKIAIVSLISMLAGCATTGEQYGASVYKAGQVNQAQNVKTIQILAVVPAKIEVDNSKAKQNAQAAGALVGALLGAAAGDKNRNNRGKATAAGTVAGGTIGAAVAGGIASDVVLVDGVTITYKDGNQVLSSTQVGRACEFKAGQIAMLVSTNNNETRIQPNSPENCPKG